MCVSLFLSWDNLTAFVWRSFCYVCPFVSVVETVLTAFVWRSFCYVCPFVSVVGQSDRICVEELLLCVSV